MGKSIGDSSLSGRSAYHTLGSIVGSVVDAIINAPPESRKGPPQAVKNLYLLYKHAIHSQGVLHYLYAKGALNLALTRNFEIPTFTLTMCCSASELR